MTVPTLEPTAVTAGDTWSWRRSFADYPASAGWSLRYVFANSSQRITFDSAADGDDHLVTRAITDTDDVVPGRYQWVAFARNGPERYQVASGEIQVRPNIEGARPWDLQRTHAAKVLAAIEAVIEERATKDQEEYTIGDRSLKRTPLSDLLEMRTAYRAEVAAETATTVIAAGSPNPRSVRVRFGRA